jgi:pilus assembly protein FimV
MTRHFARLLALGVSLFPASLYALGLGELHLNSALSQPFDAEIELLSPTSEELANLKVSLASQESFARSGLDRAQYLSSFIFRVVPAGAGRATVRITSNRAVTEPVVTFLVEAVWGNGRIQREYTVFLDPPVFVPVQPAQREEPARATPPPTEQGRNEGVIERTPLPTTPPPTEAVSPPPVSTTPAEPAQEVAPAVPLPEPAQPTAETPSEPVSVPTPASVMDSYEVQRNDSLWKIASRLRSGTPQQINQTMIALYRANPAAFAGNINRLRSGAVLRVPTADEMDALDLREATAEVSRQYSEWRPEAPTFTETTDDRGRLQLVTPQEPASSVESARAAEAAKQAEAARAEQARAQEAATAAATKAASDAEAKRLLDLKNAELARMQREREERAAAEAEAKRAAEQQAAQQAAAQQTPAQTQPPTAEAPAAEPVPEQPAAEVQPPVAQPEPAAEEPSFLDSLNWTYVALGAGLILLIGGWVVYSRRRQPQTNSLHFPMPDAGVQTMTPADFDAEMSSEPTKTRSRSQPAASFDFDEPQPDLPEAEGTKPLHSGEPPEDYLDDAPPPVTSTRAGRSADETMSSETAVHVDQQDAVAEADFHMAYGLYDQAADLVKIALSREPKRRDLRLKLLEIYFVWGNKELFLETARELNTTRNQAPQGEWDKILIMGKQIAPDDPLFRGGAVASAGDMLDVNLEGGENRVDFDLFSTPEAGESEAGASLDFEIGNTGARAKPNSHLDFLLEDSGNAQVADDSTREMDTNARTQETPTIESPVLDRAAETSREPIIDMNFGDKVGDQTAELSIDDLGLDVGSLESTGSLERTTALKDARADLLPGHKLDDIADDEMTRIAPSGFVPPKAKSAASLEPTMEMPQLPREASQRLNKSTNGSANRHDADQDQDESGEDISVSTIYLEQMDPGSGEVIDTLGPRTDETAHMLGPEDLDIDLEQLSDEAVGRSRASKDDPTAEMPVHRPDLAATAEQPRPKMDRSDVLVATSEMQEMEPVTMSEVGTKLDLARAYMDMGDPDGARSILEEVLGEGNSGQRAEAQRLLDSIR